jgi:hypothetical protein
MRRQHYLAKAAFNGDAFAFFSCYDSRRKAVKALRDFRASLVRAGERDPLKIFVEACSCPDASIHPVAEVPA